MKKEKNGVKKDKSKIVMIVLTVLLILEILLIPCLVYAEVRKVLPIVGFLILPTLLGIFILLISRNCSKDYQKKLEKISSN